MPGLGEAHMPNILDVIRARAQLPEQPTGEESDRLAREHATALAQSYPPTAYQIIEQNAARARAETDLNRELAAQRDIRIDSEINRIAKIFYTALMQRIHFEFGHNEPEWDSQLGAREKKLWLEATEILLDELKKEPIPNNAVSVIANRRIIS